MLLAEVMVRLKVAVPDGWTEDEVLEMVDDLIGEMIEETDIVESETEITATADF